MLRELKKSKAESISKIQSGDYVKLKGNALKVIEPLVAPISGRECIFYQVLIEKKGSKNSWHKVVDATETQDFFLGQQGEMVMVKMDIPRSETQIYLEKDNVQNSSTFAEPSQRMLDYLEKNGASHKNILGFNRRMRYKEGIIAIDEKIVIKGIAQWKSLKQPIEGYSFSKILSLTGTKDQKLIITDLKKALKID
ncbi:MAG: hypothetical protein HKN48_08220 [Flavobacteriaceae bacterium]|nr:hypothetical protein [Flavobacteriaceae bacterium]